MVLFLFMVVLTLLFMLCCYSCSCSCSCWCSSTEAAAVLRNDKRQFARYVDQSLRGQAVQGVHFPKNATYTGWGSGSEGSGGLQCYDIIAWHGVACVAWGWFVWLQPFVYVNCSCPLSSCIMSWSILANVFTHCRYSKSFPNLHQSLSFSLSSFLPFCPLVVFPLRYVRVTPSHLRAIALAGSYWQQCIHKDADVAVIASMTNAYSHAWNASYHRHFHPVHRPEHQQLHSTLSSFTHYTRAAYVDTFTTRVNIILVQHM